MRPVQTLGGVTRTSWVECYLKSCDGERNPRDPVCHVFRILASWGQDIPDDWVDDWVDNVVRSSKQDRGACIDLHDGRWITSGLLFLQKGRLAQMKETAFLGSNPGFCTEKPSESGDRLPLLEDLVLARLHSHCHRHRSGV